jgi:hypothetical protein
MSERNNNRLKAFDININHEKTIKFFGELETKSGMTSNIIRLDRFSGHESVQHEEGDVDTVACGMVVHRS